MVRKTVGKYFELSFIYGNNKSIPSATSDVVNIVPLSLFWSKYVRHIVSMIKPVYNQHSVIRVIMCFPVLSSDKDSKLSNVLTLVLFRTQIY